MSVNTPQPEEYMTTEEVGRLFSVTNETVRRWISDGEIKAIKINTYWRVSRSEVVRFANSRYGS